MLWISDLLLCSDKHKILRAKFALVFLMNMCLLPNMQVNDLPGLSQEREKPAKKAVDFVSTREILVSA
jgi:hypothetical protein